MSEELTLDFNDVTLDFTDVRDADEPMPAGIYGPCAIADVKSSQSSNGNPMLALRYRVQPEAPTGVGEDFWGRLVITPKAMSRVKRDLNRLGVDVTKPFKMSDLPGMLQGRQCMLRVIISEWEGNRRNEVKEIIPVDQGLRAADDVF